MTEHTPTPWEAQPFDDAEFGIGIIGLRTNDGVPYSNPTNGLVGWATMLPTDIDAHDTSLAEANAAFIVKAVNNHAALVKALQLARNRIHYLGVACSNPKHYEANQETFLPAVDEVLNAVVGGSRE